MPRYKVICEYGPHQFETVFVYANGALGAEAQAKILMKDMGHHYVTYYAQKEVEYDK